MFSGDDMREIFRKTQIIKKPTHGIISGYHELPYVCLGTRVGLESGTMPVRGKVQVSPSYGEIFGEDNIDEALTGRVFGFLGFRGRPVECTSERLEVRHLDATLDRVLSETLDDLERYEDIITGVIVTPNSRYYPVSVERFIASILDDEFAL